MKLFLFGLFLLICFLSIGIYLNRTYARFYEVIGEKNLIPPLTGERYRLQNINGRSQSVHVVFLGDSLSSGVGVKNSDQTWPYLFSKANFSDSPDVVIDILAQPSATSKDVLDKQVPRVSDSKPTFIFLEVGTNDVHNFVPEEEFRYNLDKIINQLSLSNSQAKLIVLNIPYLGEKTSVSFPYNFLLDFKIKQYNNIIHEKAFEYNLRYLDLYSATQKEYKSDSNLYGDDLFHPNEAGYKIWAEAVRNLMK